MHTTRGQTFGVVLHTAVCKLTRFVLAFSFQRYDSSIEKVVADLLRSIVSNTHTSIPSSQSPLAGTILGLDRGYFTRGVQNLVRRQPGLLTVGTTRRGGFAPALALLMEFSSCLPVAVSLLLMTYDQPRSRRHQV